MHYRDYMMVIASFGQYIINYIRDITKSSKRRTIINNNVYSLLISYSGLPENLYPTEIMNGKIARNAVYITIFNGLKFQ